MGMGQVKRRERERDSTTDVLRGPQYKRREDASCWPKTTPLCPDLHNTSREKTPRNRRQRQETTRHKTETRDTRRQSEREQRRIRERNSCGGLGQRSHQTNKQKQITLKRSCVFHPGDRQDACVGRAAASAAVCGVGGEPGAGGGEGNEAVRQRVPEGRGLHLRRFPLETTPHWDRPGWWDGALFFWPFFKAFLIFKRNWNSIQRLRHSHVRNAAGM